MPAIVPDEDTWAAFDVTTLTTGPFNFGFQYMEKADLEVTVDNVALALSAWNLTTGSVVEAAGYDGGSFTLNTAVSNARVVIARKTKVERDANLSASQLNFANINSLLNRYAYSLGEFKRDIARALLANYGTLGGVVADSDNIDAVAAIAAEIANLSGIDAEILILAGLSTEITAIAALGPGDLQQIADGLSAKLTAADYPTYAAARLGSGLTVGQRVLIRGRTASGDGGEGWFRVAAGGIDIDGLQLLMADGRVLIRENAQEKVDLDVFGIVPGTVDVALWDAMVAAMSVWTTRTVRARAGGYTFPSRPAVMTTALRVIGQGESLTVIERGYSEAGGDDVPFLAFEGASAIGSGLYSLQLRAANGTTGGTMLRGATSTAAATGYIDLENVVITPGSTGAYAWGADLDGLSNNTSGSQGLRSEGLHAVQFFGGGGAGTNAARLRNIVNADLSNIWTNGNILIGGGGSSLTNSNRVTLTGFKSVGGTLTPENCSGVYVSGTMNHVTINGTAENVVVSGDVNDLTIASGATGVFVGSVRGTLTNNAPATFTIINQNGSSLGGGLVELGRIRAADFNSTADQPLNIRLPPGFTRYRPTLGFAANNGSANLSAAVGGIYTGAGKSGTEIVAATQAFSLITGANKLQQVTVTAAGLDVQSDLSLFVALTTPAGVAGTCDYSLYGYVFT